MIKSIIIVSTILFAVSCFKPKRSIGYYECRLHLVPPPKLSLIDISEDKSIDAFLSMIEQKLKIIPLTPNQVKFPKANRLYSFEEPDSMLLLNNKTDNIRVSPHFSLGNFYEKASGEKGMLLDPMLILKLEILYILLKHVNRDADIYVSSGYRSLKENYKEGNRTKFTMHQFGKAADLYICKEGRRGKYYIDINYDGKIDKRDKWLLMYLLWQVEELFPECSGFNQIYRRHVHTDVRGKEHLTMPKSFIKRARLQDKKRFRLMENKIILPSRDEVLMELASTFGKGF